MIFWWVFFICIKIDQQKCYQENKERLHKKAHKRYQNLSKEEKERKRQYGREGYKNLSEDEKQKVAEYTKKYYRMRKNDLSFICNYYSEKEPLKIRKVNCKTVILCKNYTY